MHKRENKRDLPPKTTQRCDKWPHFAGVNWSWFIAEWGHFCKEKSTTPHRCTLRVCCSVPYGSWALLCSCGVGAEAGVGPLYGGQGLLDPTVWVPHHQLAAPKLHPLGRRKHHGWSNFTSCLKRHKNRTMACCCNSNLHVNMLGQRHYEPTYNSPAASPGLWQPYWHSWSWRTHRNAHEELWCSLSHQTCNHGNTELHIQCWWLILSLT